MGGDHVGIKVRQDGDLVAAADRRHDDRDRVIGERVHHVARPVLGGRVQLARRWIFHGYRDRVLRAPRAGRSRARRGRRPGAAHEGERMATRSPGRCGRRRATSRDRGEQSTSSRMSVSQMRCDALQNQNISSVRGAESPTGRIADMARLAVLSYHTSPLAQPGTGDGGGMNVYVRELSSAFARLGHEVDVYTRRDNLFVNGHRVRGTGIPRPSRVGRPASSLGARGTGRPRGRVHRHGRTALRARRRSRRVARQLLVERAGRPSTEARAQHPLDHDLSHARAREGRHVSGGVGRPRLSRGGAHHLLRRDSRQLRRRGRAVRAAL